MTTIEVMRKALSALLWEAGSETSVWASQTREAITALRAELERMEGVEPAYWALMDSVSQVPDLFRSEDMARVEARHRRDKYGRASLQVAPLYTAPIAPAIPALTPDEIRRLVTTVHWVSEAARWAYALAAERAGVSVGSADAAIANDIVRFGSAWERDGRRIDPLSVYKDEPAQDDQADMACRLELAEALVEGLRTELARERALTDERHLIRLAWANGVQVQYYDCGRWLDWVGDHHLDMRRHGLWRIKPA